MKIVSVLCAGALLCLAAVPALFAHCDTMDGPVAKAAMQALDTGKLDGVLIWVPASGEAEVKEAFDRTRAVREKGAEVRALADRYFLETVVRVHRAGEGEPFTGLKPAGIAPDPVIAMADKAVESGSAAVLTKAVTGHIAREINERFAAVAEARRHQGESVEAGRRFVQAYVTFLHHIEGLHTLAVGAGETHDAGAEAPAHAH